MIHVYGVEVEVIDTGVVFILSRLGISLIEAYMVEAVPFEEKLSSLYVQLLDDAFSRQAITGAADRSEIPWHRIVDRNQCGVLWADEELVVVLVVVAVGGRKTGYLMVGAIEDHVLTHGPAR